MNIFLKNDSHCPTAWEKHEVDSLAELKEQMETRGIKVGAGFNTKGELYLGNYVEIGQNVHTSWGVHIEDGAKIADRVLLEDETAIGKNATIGEGTAVSVFTRIAEGSVIEKDCYFGPSCRVYAESLVLAGSVFSRGESIGPDVHFEVIVPKVKSAAPKAANPGVDLD